VHAWTTRVNGQLANNSRPMSACTLNDGGAAASASMADWTMNNDRNHGGPVSRVVVFGTNPRAERGGGQPGDDCEDHEAHRLVVARDRHEHRANGAPAVDQQRHADQGAHSLDRSQCDGFASAANRAYLTRGGGHYVHAQDVRVMASTTPTATTRTDLRAEPHRAAKGAV
jgi:hypothetical protein